MKAKSTVPEKGKRLESPKVEPCGQRMAQVNKVDPDIDLKEFRALSEIENILEKLYRTATPDATNCEDEAHSAYKSATAILTYLEFADEGLGGGSLGESIAGYVTDAVQLQLDIVRLAGKRLYSLCRAHDSREPGDSRNS